MELAVRVVVFVIGAAMVAGTVGSAVRTVILPRGVPAKMGSVVFVGIRRLFDLRVRRIEDYESRDRVFALYGPLSLLALATTWVAVTLAGYAAMHWGLGAHPVREAFTLSGSSLLTLGFDRPPDLPKVALSFTEALAGLFLVALLISYLPSLYSSFSRREAMVTLLEVRAGSPPSGVEMIERYQLIHDLADLDAVWENWEHWFVELEETHTSQPALVFFRSPQPDHSWVTAAGAVLDGAALYLACSPDEHPKADLCERAGYLALRRIADFFGIPYDPNPDPGGPIAIARDEFDAAYDRLQKAGVPTKDDRDEAWRAFRGWRVNYDTVLITLAALVMAPYAPWSSDRSSRYRVKALRGEAPAMRFPIRFSPVNRAILTLLGMGPRHSYVEVGPDNVQVRTSYGFRSTIPRRSVTEVETVERIPWAWGIGVHGWGGRWVVNGTLRNIVHVRIEPPAPARVLGVPVKLRELWVSPEDRDGFLAAIGR